MTDKMTAEEAIKTFLIWWECPHKFENDSCFKIMNCKQGCWSRAELLDAVKLAISALQKQTELENEVERLRTVKQGRWIKLEGNFTHDGKPVNIHYCSNCGENYLHAKNYTYCPNCGYKMLKDGAE